jgi:predicted transglutaminase-like cysteine proteinase
MKGFTNGLRHIPLFLWAILMLTSCSKKPVVEHKVIHEEPIVIERTPPAGLIPESVIERAEKKYGVFAGNRYRAFNETLYRIQNSPTEVKLEAINDFFNNVPYGDDTDVWGQTDYWATPLEFLGRDKGDCEDYVIAKYFALRSLGIESEKLYFSYVKSLRFKMQHMVLSFFKTPSSVPVILDNTNYRIFPANKRKDLIPIYNFNMESSYLAGQSGQNGQRIRSNGKIHHRWDRLIRDVKRNKL